MSPQRRPRGLAPSWHLLPGIPEALRLPSPLCPRQHRKKELGPARCTPIKFS